MKSTIGLLLVALIIAAFFGFKDYDKRQQPQNITITLSLNEWDVVIKGLNEIPFKESATIINKIMMQGNTQIESAKTVQPAAPQPDTTKKKNKKK